MARLAILGVLLVIFLTAGLAVRNYQSPLPPPRGPEPVAYLVKGPVTVWYPSMRQDRRPLLLFSPAMGRSPGHYSFLAKDLASFGFIVAGVQPSSRARIDLNHREALQPVVERWMAELRSGLETVMTDPLVRNQIDASRIGIFGHSFGGAVALHLLARDRRFSRGANLDGAPQGERLHLDRPALFILGAPLPAAERRLNDQIADEIDSLCRYDGAGCRLEDHPSAGHMNFSDLAVSTPHVPLLRAHRDLTPIDDVAFLHNVSNSLREFFDQM